MSEPAEMTDREAFDALAAEMPPEGMALMAALMHQSSMSNQDLLSDLLAGAERERDEWKARALEAERCIGRMKSNVLNMLFADDPEDWNP